MTEPRSGWDDARLEAAFAARANASPATPPDLVGGVLDRIDRRRAVRPRRFRELLAAAAAIVLVAGLVGVRALAPSPPASGSTPPGSPPGSATGAEPSRSAAPELPQMTVPEALAVRDAGDDREILVAGFLSPLPALPCPAVLTNRNPALLQCPHTAQWLMADPEVVMAGGANAVSGGSPKGPAFHPSFDLVEAPEVPVPASGVVDPVPVVLTGHFHDRRAALCPEHALSACDDTFIVDRVAAVNGEPRGVLTQLRNQRFDDVAQRQVTEQPRDLVEDVDRLVVSQVPRGSILSRQLVTIDQVIGIEPILANDDFVPYVGNPATLVWIVTVLDPHTGEPIARTFALFDASNWFAEITAKGAVMIDRRASGTASTPGPIPSADPTAFDSAPTTVLGINVRDIATVMRDKRADEFTDLGRDELAIRAWYVAPDPSASCEPPLPAVHPPTPPCDAARHWLVDRPDQLGSEVGQVRTNPDHWPPVLNPILPIDVPFDVPPTWASGSPMPAPVVVLGHFLDNRVDTYAGSVYFVIDALAWTRDRPVASLDTLARLTAAATEDPASVLARIAEVSPSDAVATWTTVVDAADFAAFDPRIAEAAPEFTSGPPIWIVRRLIHNEMDGRQRLAIEWAYTADHGDRVWWTETPDSPADLATSLDLRDLDRHTTLVRVFDYDRQIDSVATTVGLATLAWKRVGPDPLVGLEIARGRSDREVAIRWKGGGCDPVWRVRIQNLGGQQILVEPRTFGDTCENDVVVRRILVRFDHPVDLERIRTGDPCCG